MRALVYHIDKNHVSGANTMVVSIWGAEGGPYMQALYVFYAIGGIISPFATETFMAPSEHLHQDHGVSTVSENWFNSSASSFISLNNTSKDSNLYINFSMTFENSTVYGTRFVAKNDRLQFAFIITAIVTVLSSLPYAYMFYIGGYDVTVKEHQRLKERRLYDKCMEAQEDNNQLNCEKDNQVKSDKKKRRPAIISNDDKIDKKQTSNDKCENHNEVILKYSPVVVSNYHETFSVLNKNLPLLSDQIYEDDLSIATESETNLKETSNDISTLTTDASKDAIFPVGNIEFEIVDDVNGSLKGCRLWTVIVFIAVVNLIYDAAEDTLGSYIVTFCVDYLEWDNVKSASLNSLYWGLSLVGGLAGIFLVQLLKTNKLLYIALTFWVLLFAGTLLASTYRVDLVLWFTVPFSGFFMVQIIPASFSWIEENVCRITGKITSLIMVATGLGLTLNPLFAGYMMQNVSFLYLIYILVGESVVCFGFFVGAYFLKNTGQCNRKQREVPAI